MKNVWLHPFFSLSFVLTRRCCLDFYSVEWSWRSIKWWSRNFQLGFERKGSTVQRAWINCIWSKSSFFTLFIDKISTTLSTITMCVVVMIVNDLFPNNWLIYLFLFSYSLKLFKGFTLESKQNLLFMVELDFACKYVCSDFVVVNCREIRSIVKWSLCGLIYSKFTVFGNQ